ncbi:MAG TPA: OsmC family protein [Verrucomicrobiae bacterium]|nr:OsmC family protein [Verrucomicrobiae bacterium]
MNSNNVQLLDAEVIVHGDGVALAEEIFAGSHKLAGDEPVSAGGTGSGPGPYEFLLAALGSCTSITVTMYARRTGWRLRGVTVWLQHSKVHATDCAECDSREASIDRITRRIRLEGPLTEEQRQRLLEIANKCPVHRTLTSKIDIMTKLV